MADDTEDREVERYEVATWPADQPFPLTPLECWYIMQGWAVRPKERMSLDVYHELPGRGLEMLDGYLVLRQ